MLSVRGVFFVCAAVLIGLAIVRLATGGWGYVDADHARYIYSGMSLLDGRGYVSEAGATYLVRSPAYPLIVGGAYALAGSDGAHLAAWSLGLAGLLLAVALAARLGGVVAMVITTATAIALPQFWEQLVTIGIDLPQAAFYLAAVALLWSPKPGYWLAAGGLFGLALLIKETAAPAVVLLPIAWLPAWSGLSWRRWASLAGLFLVAVAVVAGWWWLFVWLRTGYVFPLNALLSIVPDETGPTRPSPVAVAAALFAAAAWAHLLFTRLRDVGVRLLGLAALGLAPAVAATIALTQPARNFTVVLLLSCVVIGVALSDLLRALAPRLSMSANRAVSVAAGVALVAAVMVGQLAVRVAPRDSLPAETAAFLRPHLAPGQQIISTFLDRSALSVELFDELVLVRQLPVHAVQTTDDPAQYLWLGDRRGVLFGLRQDAWRRAMRRPGVAYLVLIGPHPLTPTELISALRSSDGQKAGLTTVKRLQGPFGTADVFEIDSGSVERTTSIHLHAQPSALLHWLDIAEAAGESDPSGALLDARPIVPARGERLALLSRRLGAGACFRPRQEGGAAVLIVARADGQGDCLTALPTH